MPYAAVASAGVLNVVLMRRNELQLRYRIHQVFDTILTLLSGREGITVCDADGKDLGKSPAAGAVGNDRCLMACLVIENKRKIGTFFFFCSHSSSCDFTSSRSNTGRILASDIDGNFIDNVESFERVCMADDNLTIMLALAERIHKTIFVHEPASIQCSRQLG